MRGFQSLALAPFSSIVLSMPAPSATLSSRITHRLWKTYLLPWTQTRCTPLRLPPCHTDLSPTPHATCLTTVWASGAPQTQHPQTTRRSPAFSFVSYVSKQHNSTWSSKIRLVWVILKPSLYSPTYLQAITNNQHSLIGKNHQSFYLRKVLKSAPLHLHHDEARCLPHLLSGLVLHLPNWPPVLGPLMQSPNCRQRHFLKTQT